MKRNSFNTLNFLSSEAIEACWSLAYGRHTKITLVKQNGNQRVLDGYLRGFQQRWYIKEEGGIKRVSKRRILSIEWNMKDDMWQDHDGWIEFKNESKSGDLLSQSIIVETHQQEEISK